MAALSRLCFFLLLLCLLSQGGQGKKCIAVKQTKTGVVVEGKPQYEVTVKNRCSCSQAKVTLLCYGLSSVMAVDPRTIRPVRETFCLVNAGLPVAGSAAVKFRYAWTTPQDFPVVSSKSSC